MIINTRYLFLGAHIDWDTNYLKHKLETMAKQGWKLTKVGPYLTFKRSEPENLQFEIDYLSSGLTWASSDETIIMDYKQLCEDSGWNYKGNYQQLFIFSAPANQEVTPLQTDIELKRQILTSIAFKKSCYFILLPLLILMNNGLKLQLITLTSYSSTIIFIMNWILFIGLLTYNLLNILQIFHFKGYVKFKPFKILPTLIRNTFSLMASLVILLLFLLLLALLFESTSFGLARALLFGFITIGLGTYICTYMIKRLSFNRQKKLFLTMICLILTTMISIHGMIIFISSTPVTKQSDLHLEYPILNEEPLQLNQSREIYFERHSSFLFSDYLVVHDELINFDYFQLRTTPFTNQMIEIILNEIKTYNQDLIPSKQQPFLYDIYDNDSNELTGYILYDDKNLLIFNAQPRNLNDPILKDVVLTLFNQLSN